jgi:carbonic anhydrase
MTFPQRLIEGYNAFAAGRLQNEQNRYRELAEAGQTPQTMVIGCCDSRVSPEVIFDARPGELFVVRNVANIVPPYAPDGQAHGVSAALEFGVAALKVKNIVVLGHAHCGGVKAFAEDAEPLTPGDFIGKWMRLMAPAAEKVGSRGAQSPADYLVRLEQFDDVSPIAQIDRSRRRHSARRLFRRRHRRFIGARSGNGRLSAGWSRALKTAGFTVAAAPLTGP